MIEAQDRGLKNVKKSWVNFTKPSISRIIVKMPPSIDLTIITKAKAGDRGAFRQLVQVYQSYLYSVASRYLGGVHEAEDAVQETFVKIWRNLNQYKPEVKFSTWLYRILVNHCLDTRKQSVFRAGQNSVAIDVTEHMAGALTPLAELTQTEVAQAIATATEALTGKQKMVFVLRDLEGMETKEVCLLLGMDETQVKSNLYYARKKMYELLKDKI